MTAEELTLLRLADSQFICGLEEANAALKKECERLRAALAGNDEGRVFFEVMSECSDFKKENERLRAAIERHRDGISHEKLVRIRDRELWEALK